MVGVGVEEAKCIGCSVVAMCQQKGVGRMCVPSRMKCRSKVTIISELIGEYNVMMPIEI